MKANVKPKWDGTGIETASYMCRNCFSVKQVRDIKVSASIPRRPAVKVYDEQIRNAIDSLISVSCTDCGEEMVRIDRSIVKQISIFNQIGYHTRYCCGGHSFINNPKLTQIVPYVTFGFDVDTIRLDPDKHDEHRASIIEYVATMQNNIVNAIEAEGIDGPSKSVCDRISLDPRDQVKDGICFSIREDMNIEEPREYSYLDRFSTLLMAIISRIPDMSEEARRVMSYISHEKGGVRF